MKTLSMTSTFTAPTKFPRPNKGKNIMTIRTYSEIGIGNETFTSTEIETNNKEYRVKRFIFPKNVEDLYVRIWILKTVIVISLCGGISLTKKDRNKFKLLIGLGGKTKNQPNG